MNLLNEFDEKFNHALSMNLRLDALFKTSDFSERDKLFYILIYKMCEISEDDPFYLGTQNPMKDFIKRDRVLSRQLKFFILSLQVLGSLLTLLMIAAFVSKNVYVANTFIIFAIFFLFFMISIPIVIKHNKKKEDANRFEAIDFLLFHGFKEVFILPS